MEFLYLLISHILVFAVLTIDIHTLTLKVHILQQRLLHGSMEKASITCAFVAGREVISPIQTPWTVRGSIPRVVETKNNMPAFHCQFNIWTLASEEDIAHQCVNVPNGGNGLCRAMTQIG